MPLREAALVLACVLLVLAALGITGRVSTGWLGLALWCAVSLLRVG